MEINERIRIIKETLKNRKITYRELSEMSNVPKPTLTNIFRGVTKNPRIDTVEAIERSLSVEKEKTPTNNVDAIKIQEILDAMKDAGMSDEKIKNITKEDIKLIAGIANEIVKNRK